MPSQTTPEQREHKVGKRAYHGRVRSGCITCRRRKVKCDEARPFCDNCTRLKRRCIYAPPKASPSDDPDSSSGFSSVGSLESCELMRPLHGSLLSQAERFTQDTPSIKAQDSILAETLGVRALPVCLADKWRDRHLCPDSAIVDVTTRLQTALRRQNDAHAGDDGSEYDPATLISEDIKLTTTMDLLRAREVPLQPSFPYFVDTFDCPAITPYDAHNWRMMKYYMAELGTTNTVISSAIIALATLQKGLRFGLPLSPALSFYQTARTAFEKFVVDAGSEFDTIVVSTFLLCLFDYVHQGTAPILADPSEALVSRFELEYDEGHHSVRTTRIISWLRLLHANALRAGGKGLISDRITMLSPHHKGSWSTIRSAGAIDTHTSTYAMLQQPLFDFYFQLQMISGQIAKLTHYHRSRITGGDQKEVIEHLLHIRSRLVVLWESRPAIQRQSPDALRSTLAADIAEPIISLIGLCAAAYHAEFVEMDRVIGDPITKSSGSRYAMQEIRNIIDGDWNCYDYENKLNPGYLRSLFLYAIECMDRDQTRWAVARMKAVQDCICRSDFFAEFGQRLSNAQLQKERRVTSKYFCIWFFGTPPPFM
ncbi:hypothetical protein AC578_5525 [Pseudocercospora eumusae]|uniref:Zn(2)-C6 fungal-type domain-containing protein n=1 Tax=Pseudocercospora eumusae TaxID=321146 RepID=A0A139H7S6_9PEZI|nr:hypothetical protein AC578_5525 [Pseudocercospora eumusae]